MADDGDLGIGVEPSQEDAVFEPDRFRADPEVRFTVEQMPIRPSLTFSVIDESQRASDLMSSWWVWFGGQPVVRRGEVPEWPRDADDRPLAHVLQVDLEAEADNHTPEVFSMLPLPTTGVIQLFHDLVTYGSDLEDSDQRGWKVRWIEKRTGDRTSDFELQAPPADIDEDRVAPAVPLNTEVSPTIPHFLDRPQGLTGEDAQRYIRIHNWLSEYPHQMNTMRRKRDDNQLSPWEQGYKRSEPASRMCGFGFVESDLGYQETLDKALPINGDDEHVLLFEINPIQCDAPDDWFHGLRPLQVWIRGSDLGRAQFDDVWCQIRTDA